MRIRSKAMDGTYLSANKKGKPHGCRACLATRVAGEVGIEPTNAGIKIRCLTTWRLPSRTTWKTKITQFAAAQQPRCAPSDLANFTLLNCSRRGAPASGCERRERMTRKRRV